MSNGQPCRNCWEVDRPALGPLCDECQERETFWAGLTDDERRREQEAMDKYAAGQSNV